MNNMDSLISTLDKFWQVNVIGNIQYFQENPIRIVLLIIDVSIVLFLVYYLIKAAKSILTPNGLISMYTNKNLFFHGIIPLLSIINYIFFENTNQLKLKHTIYSLIPVLLYGIYYMTNVLIHTENNTVSPEYDWYYFIQNGVSKLIIVVPLIFLITYLLGYGLYILNKIRKY